MFIRLFKLIKFFKCHERKLLCAIICNTASYHKEFYYSTLNSYLHNVWLCQLWHRSHLCLRALKRKCIWRVLHFIVDEKVKNFHIRDKSNHLVDKSCHWLFWFVNLYSFGFWLIFCSLSFNKTYAKSTRLVSYFWHLKKFWLDDDALFSPFFITKQNFCLFRKCPFSFIEEEEQSKKLEYRITSVKEHGKFMRQWNQLS